MIRLLGILAGSAIAVGLLIVTLGIPELSRRSPEPVEDEPPAAAPSPAPAAASVTVPESAPAPLDDALVTAEPVAQPAEGDTPAPLTDEELVERIFMPEPEPEPLPEEHWYAFWSPFRSEIAANGFVSRLQQTTGMDYRVVKLKPGVYEVAFAYTNQDDIEQKLARISAATGLDMSGG